MRCSERRTARTVRGALVAAFGGVAMTVFAQAIPVTTPKLPPRSAAPAGTAQPAVAAAAQAAAPQRAAAGPCRVQPTPDRQALTLVSGADAQARQHLPLGEFRAQQVRHSPDGRWAVAFIKLRGAAQFAVVTIDLERCEAQRTIELPAAGEDATFDGDEALLRLSDGERRIAMRDGRVK